MIDPTLILAVYFSFTNGTRAKMKGYNRWLWALLTMLGFIVGETVGSFIVVFYFCSNVIDTHRLMTDVTYTDTFTQLMKEEFTQHPSRLFTVILFGIGGYLLVRYSIDKMQPKPSTISNKDPMP